MPREGQSVDVDELHRALHFLAHEIDERGAAGDVAPACCSSLDRILLGAYLLEAEVGSSSDLFCRVGNCCDNARVCAAPADIAAHPELDFIGCMGVPLGNAA